MSPVPHSGNSLMNLFWRFFVTSLAKKGIPDYVLRVYHSKFFLLPWSSFYPTLPNMELMLEVIIIIWNPKHISRIDYDWLKESTSKVCNYSNKLTLAQYLTETPFLKYVCP